MTDQLSDHPAFRNPFNRPLEPTDRVRDFFSRRTTSAEDVAMFRLMLEAPMEEVKVFMQIADPDGVWSDEAAEAEGFDPTSREAASAVLLRWIEEEEACL